LKNKIYYQNIKHYKTKKKGENVFYHFYEASTKSREGITMIARFIKHFIHFNKGNYKAIFFKYMKYENFNFY
jgi:hypothetical protein